MKTFQKQTTVKVPQNLFRMLYSTVSDSHVYSRVEVTMKKGAKALPGIQARTGLETFLILPQSK